MEPIAVAEQFQLQGEILEIRVYGDGHINDTFLVVMDGKADRYILQRLNGQVFPFPEQVMANLRTVTDHMSRRLERNGSNLCWRVAEIIPARHGGDFVVDERKGCWRMVRFIDCTCTRNRVESLEQARQIGVGLGYFHCLLSDLDSSTLYDTLPGFHVTPNYLAGYDAVINGSRVKEDAFCGQAVEARRHIVGVLEDARRAGKLSVGVMHGDPKVNNFLFDEDNDTVVSMVDLDTVKPGLVHYDIGDCLRSACNTGGEDGDDLDQVRFDLKRCRAILEGYLAQAAVFLTAEDYDFLYDSIRLVSFELGLRFYTDYLSGDTYFKVEDSEQNLRRALVQFRLTEQIEASEADIRAMVSELQRGVPS